MEKARRRAEARREPFSPTTQIHGLCSRSQSEEVLGWVLYTMASKITQLAFDELDAPPVVVGARNWITPPDEVEEAFFPFPVDIIDAVHEHTSYR